MFTKGIIINIPNQLGLFLASAIFIQTIMPITIFTKGMKNNTTHQPGLLAILHIRYILAMGIHANHEFGVFVLLAIIIKQIAV